MKERPILMTTENVKAILEGRKTQTRRVIKPCSTATVICTDGKVEQPDWVFTLAKCPYGQVGDRLWVGETFCQACYKADKYEDVCYKEDLIREGQLCHITRCKWQPSIHMPKWASRITLEITEVSVKRVQEITYGDCMKEGLDMSDVDYRPGWDVSKFKNLWDSINDKGSPFKEHPYAWYKNPWVWVITFKHLV